MRYLKFSIFALFALAISPRIIAAQNSGDLQNLMAVMTKVNALRIAFRKNAAAPTAASLLSIKKQAALLKMLPAGTVVEIGAHTASFGDEDENLRITQQRADKIRALLIAAGIKPGSLTAEGFGSSSPQTAEATEPANERIEFVAIKSPSLVPAVPANGNSIVAGRGWKTVVLGATRDEVEAALGTPDIFKRDSVEPSESYSTFYKHGVVVVYSNSTRRAIKIRFIGNSALYGSQPSEFSSFEGLPDKGLAWGASAGEIISAYGAPAKRVAYEDYSEKQEFLDLYYPGIQFILKGDKLFQINLEGK